MSRLMTVSLRFLTWKFKIPKQPQSSPNILKSAGQKSRGKQSRLGWGILRAANAPNGRLLKKPASFVLASKASST